MQAMNTEIFLSVLAAGLVLMAVFIFRKLIVLGILTVGGLLVGAVLMGLAAIVDGITFLSNRRRNHRRNRRIIPSSPC